MTKSKGYPTDLKHNEWQELKGLFPATKATGRPREHSWRSILNGIFSMVRSGCAWRLLLHEYPPYKTVYHYFR